MRHNFLECYFASQLRSTNDGSNSRTAPSSEFHLFASFRDRVLEDEWIDLSDPARFFAEDSSAANGTPRQLTRTESVARIREISNNSSTSSPRYTSAVYVALSDRRRKVTEVWLDCSELGNVETVTEEDLGGVLARALDETNLLDFHPVPEATIAALPKVRIDKSTVGDCSICCDGMKLRERVTRLRCSHLYHTECIEVWLSRSARCPLCRASVE